MQLNKQALRKKLYRSLHNCNFYKIINYTSLLETRQVTIFLNEYGFHKENGSTNYYIDFFNLQNKAMYKIDNIVNIKNFHKKNQLIITYQVKH